MLLNILAGFTHNIMKNGFLFFFFARVDSFGFYSCIFGFGVRDCFHPESSICGFVFWLCKGWPGSSLDDNNIVEQNLPIFNYINCNNPWVYNSINRNQSLLYSTTSSPPSLTDDESTRSNASDSDDDTPEEMANKYRDNPEGLDAREERRKDEISVEYVQKVKDLEERELDSEEYERERDSLRKERDNNLEDLAEKHQLARGILSSRESETDYSD